MRTMDTVKFIPASEIAMPTERAVIAALLIRGELLWK